ncbi:unnamed protein product [Rotaria sordida]|uniref:PiggyBac transposable element-derived protein domain-containing protein n=1 Tax=Rotaria sordida TaxID=392033 RepID=A0A814L4V0_9BILA|nr:unnamed protein product [Rotaria sordida]
MKNGESQTSEDDDEINLENLKLDDDSTRKSLYNPSSVMTWSSIPQHSTKKNSSNDTIEKAEPTEITDDISSIEHAFICFMSEKITQKSLIYSNMEYTRNIASNEKPEEITMIELKAFMGLLLLAGLLGKSKTNLKCLWRRSPLESPIFKATMSRSRFEKMMSCLRFDDETTREERKKIDKFAAVREIWSYFENNLKTCCTSGSYVTIDEQLLGFRGNCPFRQFIPKKPDKYGLKFWLCVDVESYYVFNTFLYIGRQSDQERQQHTQASVSIKTWSSFTEAVIKAFGSTKVQELKFEQLKWYKQTVNQPVTQYYDKIIELCKNVDPAMPDSLKLKYLMAGIRESLKLHVGLQDPKTTDTF